MKIMSSLVLLMIAWQASASPADVLVGLKDEMTLWKARSGSFCHTSVGPISAEGTSLEYVIGKTGISVLNNTYISQYGAGHEIRPAKIELVQLRSLEETKQQYPLATVGHLGIRIIEVVDNAHLSIRTEMYNLNAENIPSDRYSMCEYSFEKSNQ